LVEPYELRRTQDGNLVLLVVNDRGQPRTYRVDRIAAVRPTDKPFTPKYIVAFCSSRRQVRSVARSMGRISNLP
jgi:predicted DNA-binding transcriptional regulator YafY